MRTKWQMIHSQHPPQPPPLIESKLVFCDRQWRRHLIKISWNIVGQWEISFVRHFERKEIIRNLSNVIWKRRKKFPLQKKIKKATRTNQKCHQKTKKCPQKTKKCPQKTQKIKKKIAKNSRSKTRWKLTMRRNGTWPADSEHYNPPTPCIISSSQASTFESPSQPPIVIIQHHLTNSNHNCHSIWQKWIFSIFWIFLFFFVEFVLLKREFDCGRNLIAQKINKKILQPILLVKILIHQACAVPLRDNQGQWAFKKIICDHSFTSACKMRLFLKFSSSNGPWWSKNWWNFGMNGILMIQISMKNAQRCYPPQKSTPRFQSKTGYSQDIKKFAQTYRQWQHLGQTSTENGSFS